MKAEVLQKKAKEISQRFTDRQQLSLYINRLYRIGLKYCSSGHLASGFMMMDLAIELQDLLVKRIFVEQF